MAIAYSFNESGEFAGEVEAQESPLEPGVVLVPAGATLEPVPAAVEGKKRKFVDGAWSYEDVPEQPQPTAEHIRAQKWEAIKAERDRRAAGGVKVGDKWLHSDTDSRIKQLGLVMFGAAVPPVQWKTMDGSFVAMTQTLANQIFQAVAAADQAIFAKAEQHRAALMASADPANYDFSTGWPLIYGE